MHPIENILNITMSELKQMAEVDTIIGKPFVTPDGQTIVPISKLSFGFVSGGGEYAASAKAPKEGEADSYPFAGGQQRRGEHLAGGVYGLRRRGAPADERGKPDDCG